MSQDPTQHPSKKSSDASFQLLVKGKTVNSAQNPQGPADEEVEIHHKLVLKNLKEEDNTALPGPLGGFILADVK